MSSTLSGRTSGYSLVRSPINHFFCLLRSSHGLWLLFKGNRGTQPLPTCSTFLEVFNPCSVFPLRTAASLDRDSLSRSPAPPGSLNLMVLSSVPSLPTLFHAGSALGDTLQSLIPHAQQHAVSSALPLMTFVYAFRVSLRTPVRHSVS